MFNKNKKKIKQLQSQIHYMEWEWNEERKMYDDDDWNKFFKQRVDWVIGGINLKPGTKISRPMYQLDETLASKIAELTFTDVTAKGIKCKYGYHWRASENCWVIEIEIAKEPTPIKISSLTDDEWRIILDNLESGELSDEKREIIYKIKNGK